jgi:hypothetical protein
MLWLVLLPFRLFFTVVFGLIALPFVILLLPFALLLLIPLLVIKFAFRLVAAILFIPLMIIAAVGGMLLFGVAALAMALPLLPLVFLGFVVWLLMRRPVAVV